MRADQCFIKTIKQNFRHQGIKKLPANSLPVIRWINP